MLENIYQTRISWSICIHEIQRQLQDSMCTETKS